MKLKTEEKIEENGCPKKGICGLPRSRQLGTKAFCGRGDSGGAQKRGHRDQKEIKKKTKKDDASAQLYPQGERTSSESVGVEAEPAGVKTMQLVQPSNRCGEQEGEKEGVLFDKSGSCHSNRTG